MSVGQDQTFRVQLAFSETPPWEYFAERMPWICSFKLDGIRAVKRFPVHPTCLISRTLKPFPSAFVHKTYALPGLEGFDGELIVPIKQGPTIYHDTYSAVMTQGSLVPVNWHLFDIVDYELPFCKRLELLQARVAHLGLEIPGLCVVEQRLINTVEELIAFEKEALDLEYEGLIARDPQGMYRGNRSSLKQRNMIKIVRKIRFEVEVIDMEQMERNDNEATTDARGYTVRSSHKENKVLLPMCGVLICRRLDNGMVIRVGTGQGFDHALKSEIYLDWPKHKGWICTVESKPYGEKDAPRQASWVGWKSPIDMGEPT